MERFKEKARQMQVEAQQKLEAAKEAAKEAAQVHGEKLQQNIEAAKEAAKQKAATIDVAKLKEGISSGSLSSLGLLPSATSAEAGNELRDTTQQSQSSEPDSSDDATTEHERLVKGEEAGAGLGAVRAGLGAIGSRLGTIGSMGRLGLDQSLSSAKELGAARLSSAKELGAAKVDALRSASSKSLDSAKAIGTKGADGVRAAKAASSAACSSGIDKVRSAKDLAKERGAEALNAASAVSGVSLSRQKEPTTRLGKLCACCPSLTFKQRLGGAVACLVLGTLLSLFSLGSLAQLLLGNPLPFAFKYSFGNLLSLCASSFLVGPANQCRDMCKPSRRVASIAYLGTLVLTLLSVFVFKLALLALLFIVLQAFALTWYMLSYVPFGQAAALKLGRAALVKVGLLPKRGRTSSTEPISAASEA